MLVKLPETLQASQGQQENGAYETIHALGVYYWALSSLGRWPCVQSSLEDVILTQEP